MSFPAFFTNWKNAGGTAKQNCNKKNQKKLQQKKTSLYFYFTSFSFIHFSMAALVSGFTPRIAPLILVS